MEQWIAWGLLGLIAGSLARLILPGQEKGGWLSSMILGIIGAFVGGWIARKLGHLPPVDPGQWLPEMGSVVSATVGAIVVLSLWKWLRK